MTFKQKIQEYLRSLYLFDRIVEPIVQAVMNDESNKEMKDRWNDDIGDYPPYMVPIILVSVNTIALAWLKEKMPEHFLIPFLENKVYGTPIPEVNHGE